MSGCMYILECSDRTFYTGSTKNLARRFNEHRLGLGANYTKQRLPVKLIMLKNTKELIMHLKEKNRFRVGQERKRRH